MRLYAEVAATERELGYVEVLFVYPSKFTRGGQGHALTPLSALEPEIKILLSTAEQDNITAGDLSYELSGRIPVVFGASEREIDANVIRHYRAFEERFRAEREEPQLGGISNAVRIIDLPNGGG